ncbi:MAG TPA: hypothetical protein VK632_10375, partial [Verrucomicrobiae bacterium]|nr:hypothetical protein [Verrucomicrobiae bacterium]
LSFVQILGDLWGAYWQYLYHLLSGNRRRRYKSLGRVFHYSEMVRAKRAGMHKQPKKLLKMNYPATSGWVQIEPIKPSRQVAEKKPHRV